jgi:DNA-binding transcriptional ArsR family regulator
VVASLIEARLCRLDDHKCFGYFLNMREPRVAAAAALIGNPGRAAMLGELMDGRALPATELAAAAGLSAAGASDHLPQLVAGGLLTVMREGRHRYYRLANEHVAAVLEGLATLGHGQPVRRARPDRHHENPLRFARTCYDHLAGELGVSIASALQNRMLISAGEGKRFSVTPAGAQWLAEKLRIEIDALKPARHGIACGCLDWTERRYHLAGPLGAALLGRCFDLAFLRRAKERRAVRLTLTGRNFLALELGVKMGR